MFQQVFVPASKGLIKSAPSSLIPDGSFQEAVNVRFGDGYVEKVEGFQWKKQITHLDDGNQILEHIMKIHLYKKGDGSTKNIIHTTYVKSEQKENSEDTIEVRKGCVYLVDSLDENPIKLSDDTYDMFDFGHISGVNAFDEYFFTSLGSNIYYWNTNEQRIKKLEGTYEVDPWVPSNNGEKTYQVGDIVRPYSNYTGYIYKCVSIDKGNPEIIYTEGNPGETEPKWAENMIDTTVDNEIHWVACGSVDLEGQDDGHRTLNAQCIEVFKGFLFVANTQEGGESHPTRLRWSQWQNPRLWHNNEDGSGLAGYIDVDDTDGEIVALKRIGDVLYVYKHNSIIALTYTGDADTTFSKEVVTTKAGVIAPEAIVELPHMNIFLGEDDIYQFDGNTCVSIGENINKWFYTKYLNQAVVERVFSFYDEKNQEVVFAFNTVNENNSNQNNNNIYPLSDFSDISLNINNDYGLIYNIKLKTWSIRELSITTLGKMNLIKDVRIDDLSEQNYGQSSQIQRPTNDVMINSPIYAGTRLYNMAGDKDGNLYVIGGYTDSRKQNGYEGYVVTKVHHMEEPGKVKRLMRIQFHIETIPKQYDTNGNETQGYGLYCQVGTAWSPETVNDDDVTWSEKKYINLKRPTASYAQHHIIPYIDVDLTARYFRLRFGTEGNDTYFKILGYTLYYQVRGDE